MSTSIDIHSVVRVEHFVRTFAEMATTHIVLFDAAGNKTELVLYAVANEPLTIPVPTRYRVGSDYRQVEEAAQ